MTLDVLYDLLDGDDGKDEEERHNGDVSPCGRHSWDLLQQPNCQEEDVRISGPEEDCVYLTDDYSEPTF